MAGGREGLFLDLGSGGGLPGLVLATAWPGTGWILLDASHRSARFLREAVEELGIADRVSVIKARAEEGARDPQHRGAVHTVVARSFGSPATTAECAAGFLAVGGRLMVSEPPERRAERWPATGLSVLGQRLSDEVNSQSGHHFVVIEQAEPASPRFPRRTGTPQRRPLF